MPHVAPNTAFKTDPLNVASLPATDGMELDYRTETKSWTVRWRYTAIKMLGLAAAGIFLTLFFRFVGPLISSWFYFVLFTSLSILAALANFRAGKPMSVCLVTFCEGPALWMIVQTAQSANPLQSFVTLFFAATIVTQFLSHAIVQDYSRWMHAAPHLDRDTRVWWLRIWSLPPWRGRFSKGFTIVHPRHDCDHVPTAISRSRNQAEYVEWSCYSQGLLLAVPTAYLFGLLSYWSVSNMPFAGLAAVATYLAVLLVFGFLNVIGGRPRGAPLLIGAAIVTRAVVFWFNYNLHRSLAGGLFQPRFGAARQRFLLAVVALLTLSVSVLPIASYFPLVLICTDESAWLNATAAHSNALAKSKAKLSQVVGAASLPSRNAAALTIDQLTDAEQLYAQGLSATGRDQYLQLLSEERGAAPLPLIPPDPEALRWYLTATPESWVLLAGLGLLTGNPLFIWALLCSYLFCLFMPIAVLFATVFAIGGRVLLYHHRQLGMGVEDPDEAATWNAYVTRLSSSNHEIVHDGAPLRERDHLWIGVNPASDYPVLLHRDILKEHAHILGDTGSGKTALGIAPLVAQLIERADSSVVIIDLKGDMALFEAAREGAASARTPEGAPLPFRFVTSEVGACTHVFNPFLQKHIRALTPEQQAEILVQSLGLEHGEEYGKSYFSRINRDLLHRVLATYQPIRSFCDIKEALPQLRLEKKEREDAGELFSTINLLATIEALNATPDTPGMSPQAAAEAIDFSSVVRKPQVVYFYLPAAIDAASVREVGKLALYSLLVAARRRRADGSSAQVFLFIDEFQQLVSENLEIILRQARSMGIGAILANQTISDLRKGGVNLIPILQANTRFRQFFSATDLEQQDAIIKASGEGLYRGLASLEVTMRGGHEAYQLHRWLPEQQQLQNDLQEHEIDPHALRINTLYSRIGRDDVIYMSDHPRASVVQITRGKGYTQFGGFSFIMRSHFHIPGDLYVRRANAPWPDPSLNPGTITAPLEQPTKSTPKAPVIIRRKRSSTTTNPKEMP